MALKRNEKGQFVKGSQNIKHGAAKVGKRTRLHRIWSQMKNRCQNPNHSRYKDYGGRGISVCQEWREFKGFQKWARENGYSEDLEIDRQDNDKGYKPENCHFVTPQEQANNRRDNHLLTYNGETKTVSQWAREKNMKPNTLLVRLRRNWSTERALTEPLRRS